MTCLHRAIPLLLVGLFAGCVGGGGGASIKPVDTGLASLANSHPTPSTVAQDDHEIADLAAQAAADVRDIRRGTTPQPPRQTATPATAPLEIMPKAPSRPVETEYGEAVTRDKVPAMSTGLVALRGEASAPETAPPAAPAQEHDAKQEAPIAADTASAGGPLAPAQLGAVVARAIRQVDAQAPPVAPASTLLTLLERECPTIWPLLGDSSSEIRRAIGDADSLVLLAARQRLLATPESRSAPAAPAKAEAPATVLAIPTAQLCTRVTSFGRYDPIGQQSFVAGSPIRAIVYTEIEGFVNRDSGAEEKAVELSQRLALFPENGSSEVWSMPEQSVSETARRARRDFYLIQQVDLPRNLSLGAYNLKVTVRDRIAGAQAETTIPIRIVAGDAAAHR